MPKIFQQESKVIALGEENNDMYMSLDMIFLTSEVNLNNIEYSEEFIYGVETDKAKYIGLPLQCDVSKLEKGEYDKLTHKYNKVKKTFGTVSIGSFVDFKTQRNGDVLELVASARVWKRNPKTCDALEELYGSDEGLKFSYEVLVGNSTKEGKITKVPKDDSNNPIGSCVVSNPAVKTSVAITLCAAYESDFIINEIIEGGEQGQMQRTNEFSQEDMFKNTKVTLIAELDMNQIQKKIYNALQVFLVEDWYQYDAIDQTMNFIVVKKWSEATLYKIDYTVDGENVILSNKRLVTKEYNDIPEEDPMTIAELEKKVADLNIEIASKDAIIETSNIELVSVNEKLTAKETELAEVNTNLTTVSETLLAKTTEIAEFAPIKEAHETMLAEKVAEKLVADKVALKEKFSKVLSAEVLIEMAEALENLDEAKLNSKIVELAMATANEIPAAKPVVEITLASRITDSVKISGAEPGSLQEKYAL